MIFNSSKKYFGFTNVICIEAKVLESAGTKGTTKKEEIEGANLSGRAKKSLAPRLLFDPQLYNYLFTNRNTYCASAGTKDIIKRFWFSKKKNHALLVRKSSEGVLDVCPGHTRETICLE